ncbi:NifB/NifX family molybdenum-iron cluster-binding protein [Desulfohalovibrio reitneri]|uniref:NifB/NifX family molybdenum-iron cluster-binding protein n=1 Tax=Desulfohalovibrio reitneri TaxID=1307759 RepID=UPI00068AE5E7|nr:hypothetical protein [Desulfohalovibrio reitneri]
MLICLACHENRLASVFENATELRLFDLAEDGHIRPAGRLPLPSKDPTDRISATLACGARFLICGALCRRVEERLAQSGLSLRSWTCGQVDEVLRALREDKLDALAMPGRCRRNKAPCDGQGRGRRGALSAHNTKEEK